MKSALVPAAAGPTVMARLQTPPPRPPLSRDDFLFAIFRHKKIIIISTLLGLVAAALVFFLYPPSYESRAKLLVRYVLDRSAIDSVDRTTSSNKNSDAAIGAEVEILTSWDLAVQVADAIGPKRILKNSSPPPTKEAAAAVISRRLQVTAQRGSNIIFIGYHHPEPELATQVLDELLSRYFIRHLEVHRSAGAFDFVTQQTDRLKTRLDQTEDGLKSLKGKIGIVSLTDGMASLGAERSRIEDQLHTAEADLAEQRARVEEMHLPLPTISNQPASKTPATKGTPALAAGAPAPSPSAKVVDRYQTIVARLDQLRQSKLELLQKYTQGSVMVQAAQSQINQLESDRDSLQKQYPTLPAAAQGAGSTGSKLAENISEPARLAGLMARAQELRSRLGEVDVRIKQLTDAAPEIADLERRKEMEETTYKYFANTLEKARVDEALDPSKIPNISAVQRPTPPMLMTKQRNTWSMGLAGAGLIVGLAWALGRELILSQTVKRPSQLEAQLNASVFMTVPDLSRNGHDPASGRSSGHGSALTVKRSDGLAPWDPGHFIRRYSEAIRDRLGLFFELHKLHHKPKLVGVTSFTSGAGTSTIAAGLAAALSETNEGKVLLVDVSLGPEEVHPFFKGKPAYPLTTALQSPQPMDAAADNLYLAQGGQSHAGPAQLGLKKFFDLMPNLKASEFDYIIFDMPPLTSISQTWGMAAFMDKMLLVVEAEKSNRELIKRGYSKLMNERDNVSVILNKARTYLPKSLDNEI